MSVLRLEFVGADLCEKSKGVRSRRRRKGREEEAANLDIQSLFLMVEHELAGEVPLGEVQKEKLLRSSSDRTPPYRKLLCSNLESVGEVLFERKTDIASGPELEKCSRDEGSVAETYKLESVELSDGDSCRLQRIAELRLESEGSFKGHGSSVDTIGTAKKGQ